MTLIIDLPGELAQALNTHAQAEGVDAAGFARRVLERALGMEQEPPGPPFKTGRGLLAKYGRAPSAEEIDANRADMFRGFGENAS
ncbi:MAG TPA: hypothetical protein VGR73_06585 [Bryobacteraceae bacterium]|nr:hypothetical protein [Bryobacteraceae bacterium]